MAAAGLWQTRKEHRKRPQPEAPPSAQHSSQGSAFGGQLQHRGRAWRAALLSMVLAECLFGLRVRRSAQHRAALERPFEATTNVIAPNERWRMRVLRWNGQRSPSSANFGLTLVSNARAALHKGGLRVHRGRGMQVAHATVYCNGAHRRLNVVPHARGPAGELTDIGNKQDARSN
jgi:hypothetical protein